MCSDARFIWHAARTVQVQFLASHDTPPNSVRTHPSYGPEGLPGCQVVVAAVVDARLLESLIRAGWGHLAEVQRRLREQQDCCCTCNPALLVHRDGLCGAAGDQTINGDDDRHVHGGTAQSQQ